MIAVSYIAQAVEADGTTTVVLKNGRTSSISASTAAALNEGRQRNGLPAIPTVTLAEAQTLATRLGAGGSGDHNSAPADEDPQ